MADRLRIVFPKIEEGNILSITCIYCYEEILFELPDYRLKLGPFPILLVSNHGNPEHEFAIEVHKNHEVKVVRRTEDQPKFKSIQVQEPVERPEGKNILKSTASAQLFSMEVPRLPVVHSFLHPIPKISREVVVNPPSDQLKEIPALIVQKTQDIPARSLANPPYKQTEEKSPLNVQKSQEIPSRPVIQDNINSKPSSQIKALIQKLPKLTQDQVAEELLQIAPYFKQKPIFFKVASEITNWARDISRMEWDDIHIHMLTRQLKFWNEKILYDK